MACCVPYLGFDYFSIVEGDQFTGKLNCDGWHDVVGDLISCEAVNNVGFAGACVSDEDDSLRQGVLFTMSLNSPSPNSSDSIAPQIYL